MNTDSHVRPRHIPEVKNSGNKSDHARLQITGNRLKTSGRDVSLVKLYKAPGTELFSLLRGS